MVKHLQQRICLTDSVQYLWPKPISYLFSVIVPTYLRLFLTHFSPKPLQLFSKVLLSGTTAIGDTYFNDTHSLDYFITMQEQLRKPFKIPFVLSGKMEKSRNGAFRLPAVFARVKNQSSNKAVK